MQRIKSFFLLAILVTMISSCATIYKGQVLSNDTKQYKTMAILPFHVQYEGKKIYKKYTLENIREMEMDEGYRLQSEMYVLMLKKSETMTVDIQDLSKTNAKLKDANLNYEAITSMSKNEIANLLGVDVVMSGTVFRKKPISTGGAIAIGAATFAIPFGVIVPFVVPTNDVKMDVNLHEVQNGDLMWKYNHRATGGLGSTAEGLSQLLMKNVRKKFPLYEEAKK